MNGLGRKKEKKENTQSIFTRETLGVVLVLFATLCLVCLITRDAVFSAPGKYVNAFLFGCFGFFAYAVDIFVIILGVRLIVDKKSKLSLKRKTLATLAFIFVALITHVITMAGKNLPFGEYVKTAYSMAEGGFSTASGGGLFVALIAYPITKIITDVGCYVVFGILLSLVVYFLIKDYKTKGIAVKNNEDSKFKTSFVKESSSQTDDGENYAPIGTSSAKTGGAKQSLFVNNADDFAFKSKRELNKSDANSNLKFGFSDGGLGVVNNAQEKSVTYGGESYKQKLDYIKTPAKLDVDTLRKNATPSFNPYENYGKNHVDGANVNVTTVSDYIPPRPTETIQEKEEQSIKETEIPFIEHNEEVAMRGDSALDRSLNFEKNYVDTPEIKEPVQQVDEGDVVYRAVRDGRIEEIIPEQPKEDIPFIEEQAIEDNFSQVVEEPPKQSPISSERRVRDIFKSEEIKEEVKEQPKETLGFTSRVSADNNLSSRRNIGFDLPKEEVKEEKPKKVEPPINREYFRPPFDLLERYMPPVDAPKENHQERMEIIQRTLEEFHINAVPQSYVQGPSITRYEIMMPAGVSVKKVLNFDDDLKMRLAARDGVRIEAPIPGKNLVGIEVANNVKTTVGLREILEGYAEQKSKDGALMFALGKDLVGKPIMDDLSKGPHYLVAGATGSGKSVCLNLMIVSLIMRYSPEDLRLILVDPKGVEFINYEHIPHLMIDEIITEPKKALAVLSWAYNEMERRFSVFRESGGGLVVDIDSYNSVVANDKVAKMPRIVIIIDELADLMETCKKDLESRIRAIAQKARAAGIHLVLATQRPSVDIITGTIKANLPSRIAFKVMNFNDSQTILSEAGAEKLLGNGDMLYKTARMSSVERYQGAYISSREVNSVVNYIKEHNTAYFDDELKDFLDKESRPKQEEAVSDGGDGGDDANEINDFFLKALWLAVNTETVSISQLQRRFQIGYSRAGGLVDKMERMGFVSGNEGSKARRVLLTREQFEERFGSMPD